MRSNIEEIYIIEYLKCRRIKDYAIYIKPEHIQLLNISKQIYQHRIYPTTKHIKTKDIKIKDIKTTNISTQNISDY